MTDTTRSMGDLSLGSVEGGVMLLVSGAGVLSFHYLAEGTELLLGRAPTCDISIPHPKLSREHVKFIGGPTPRLKDLGSTNGTLVDGRRLGAGEEIELRPATRLRVGPLMVLVIPGGGSDVSAMGRDHLTVSNPASASSPILAQVARSHVNVLIRGETGAGKEVLAETIHTQSGRKGPFLRINCAAIAESLLESELFGHEKGAFTGATTAKPGLFEAADGGSVLLDEIGEMSPSLQAKLLRVLETREATRVGGLRPVKLDVRFMAATHRDLPADVNSGRFRRDLYYRLNGITLLVPPLRERRGLIGVLAAKFADAAAERLGRTQAVRFSPEAIMALQNHPWPGNVRELKAVIERAVVLAGSGDLGLAHILLDSVGDDGRGVPAPAGAVASSGTSGPSAASAGANPPGGSDGPELSAKEQEERGKILAALDACGGNQTRAAKMLGISRATLVHKLDIYRLPRPRK